MQTDPRFDVIYDGLNNLPHIDYHFCREFDGDQGCFGTSPHHGCSYEEAKQEIINHLITLTEQWRNRSLKDWLRENESPSDIYDASFDR
jgi:hypothetical protein